MFYARLDDKGSVLQYPYTLTDLRLSFPTTSFPDVVTPEDAAAFGVVPVKPTPPPQERHDRVLEREAVFDGKEWVEVWRESEAPPELVAQRTEAAAQGIRARRDELLKGSDWTQAPDALNAGANQDAWARYRQELREITDQPGFPWEVAWPEPPVLVRPDKVVDYRAFYDALIASPAYMVIRQKAVTSAPVLASCVEFIAAIGDAKAGRPNPAAIQACVDLLCMAAQFTPEELAGLAQVMAVGGLDQVYRLPG